MTNWIEIQKEWETSKITLAALAVEADTVPLAICLAALKSRGVEI